MTRPREGRDDNCSLTPTDLSLCGFAVCEACPYGEDASCRVASPVSGMEKTESDTE